MLNCLSRGEEGREEERTTPHSSHYQGQLRQSAHIGPYIIIHCTNISLKKRLNLRIGLNLEYLMKVDKSTGKIVTPLLQLTL